jgi:hypothetical protein
MKRIVLQMMALLMAARAFPVDIRALPDSRGADLLDRKCIQTGTAGLLPARFEGVAAYLDRPDLVERIQAAYRRSVSKDGSLDFPIIRTGPDAYYYINEKNRRTDLTELYRGQTSDCVYELVYHAAGRRFFGRYEVLVRVKIIDAGPVGTAYTASVDAYPHSGTLRFLARRFGTVERYFRRRTHLIARVSEKICRELEYPLPPVAIHPDPVLLQAR